MAKAVGVTDPTCMIFFTERILQSCKPTSIWHGREDAWDWGVHTSSSWKAFREGIENPDADSVSLTDTFRVQCIGLIAVAEWYDYMAMEWCKWKKSHPSWRRYSNSLAQHCGHQGYVSCEPRTGDLCNQIWFLKLLTHAFHNLATYHGYIEPFVE